MERVDGVLGNVHDDERLARARDAHAEAETLERVVIPAARRRRSRFRTTTDAGTDVGVVLDRPALSPGDVLLLEDDRMIVVAFEPVDALAVELPTPTPTVLEAAIELGHRVGNQHWDLAVRDGTVYVPLEADRHIVERVVSDVVPAATVAATTVDAALFVTGTDGCDPGDEANDVDHGHEHGHDHEHELRHGHGHERAHGHDHHDDDHGHEQRHEQPHEGAPGDR